MYILFHVAAVLDWECVHLDESRAFLSSEYKGVVPVVASIKGVGGVWSVRGALYGLKTSPRDYRDEVVRRLREMGYVKLGKSACIFSKGTVVVFQFVDDFLLTGPMRDEIDKEVRAYRERARTTDPIWDPVSILGHEMERDRERRVIKLGMGKKIAELVVEYGEEKIEKRSFPMGKEQFIVKEEDLEVLGSDGRILGDEERRMYQSLVGSMMWIGGMRHDIAFSLSYLAGNGRAPRVHHLRVAEQVSQGGVLMDP